MLSRFNDPCHSSVIVMSIESSSGNTDIPSIVTHSSPPQYDNQTLPWNIILANNFEKVIHYFCIMERKWTHTKPKWSKEPIRTFCLLSYGTIFCHWSGHYNNWEPLFSILKRNVFLKFHIWTLIEQKFSFTFYFCVRCR